MARPTKAGLDYFPLNCTFDDKTELIIAEYGLIGLGIIIRLYQKIYSSKGYYCNWNDDVALLFSRNNGVSGNVVSEVINACFRRDLLNKEFYEKYGILTSKGIQERYFEAVSRRSKIEIEKEYLLIVIPQKTVNVDNNSINVDNNSINVDDNATKEIKGNKSKLNEIMSSLKEAENEKQAFLKDFTFDAGIIDESTAYDLFLKLKSDINAFDYYVDKVKKFNFNNDIKINDPVELIIKFYNEDKIKKYPESYKPHFKWQFKGEKNDNMQKM